MSNQDSVDTHPDGRNAILFVDDEPSNVELFRLEFEENHRIFTASDGNEALAILGAQSIGVVMTDERMPGMRGVDLLARVHDINPEISRVIVSAYDDAERLLLAMNRGHAHEYILKPWNRDELSACIDRCLALNDRWQTLAQQAGLGGMLVEDEHLARAPYGLVGMSGSLAPTVSVAERAAMSNAPIIIAGETGTGKEVLASFIHAKSRRSKGPFVRTNCSAFAEGVLESELFGHEQGAFTGAIRGHRGRFELAHGGTIFLDEIGDVSPRVQTRLLRVLQEQSFERVGGNKTINVDVRVIAASHRDLTVEVAEGRFRQDLFYRLNVIPIQLPPLRDRRDDVPSLVEHFIAKHGDKRTARRVADSALVALKNYDWPGNIRELENVVRRALALGIEEELSIEDFCLKLSPPQVEQTEATSARDDARIAEARKLRELIVSNGGNLARAARSLGIPRTTLASRAEKLGLL